MTLAVDSVKDTRDKEPIFLYDNREKRQVAKRPKKESFHLEIKVLTHELGATVHLKMPTISFFYFLIILILKSLILTCGPKHEPPSHLPPHNISVGHPHAPAPSKLHPMSDKVFLNPAVRGIIL